MKIIELIIDENDEYSGVDAISLVEYPAIEENWVALNKNDREYKFKAVDFDLVKTYGIFVVIGVIFGTLFAAQLDTKSLILFFSIIIFILGIYLLFMKEKKINVKIKVRLIYKIIFGFISGFISAPMGIGGAVMNVPIL